jgi:hypothetical protein
MPVIQETKTEYQKPQTGLQPSRCIKIIDLGTQNIAEEGQPTKLKRQLNFQWELPEDKMEDGRPLVISKKINLAGGDKAVLTKFAKAAIGKELVVGEDPLTLIGAVCNLNLVSWSKNGKSGVGIDGFAPLMKGQTVPPAVNEYVVFDLDKFDQSIFDGLHEYYRKVISESPEYAELKAPKQDYAAAKNAPVRPVQQSEHVAIDETMPW